VHSPLMMSSHHAQTRKRRDFAGSLVPALGVQLLEALHDSPGVQKHSPELLDAVGQALEVSRQRTPPSNHFRQNVNKWVPMGSLTLLEFTSDGLPKRTPASRPLYHHSTSPIFLLKPV
jgi:hypothetical protein